MRGRDLLLLMGPLIGITGALTMAFHRPFVRLASRLPTRGRQQVEASLPYLFKPTDSGHVRVLWVISAAWVVIGVILTLAGIGIIPAPAD